MDEPAESASSQFRSQWTNPGDVFSVLLIVGADVIQLALAALTGHTLTPIAFSFGWVAYGISAVVSAVGENRLVRCPPEIDMDVVNLASGYGRPNRSWLLARLVRTFDHWAAEEVRAAVRGVHILPTRDEEEGLLQGRKRPEMYAGLCVVVCKWVQNGGSEPGVPALDGVWWSGLLVSAVQLGIAAIPWGLYGNWGIFVATACGTLLAYASGSFPQWRQEKWHWRKQNKTVALVPISGRRLAIVILGADHGFDLEALAGGATLDRLSTRIYTGILAALWLVLLVTCTGIKTDTWYLLAVGGLGMLQNLAVAGLPRSPEALGIPIELVPDSGVFAEHKVMWALMELEMKYPGTGRQLVGMFFPGKLMGWETEWWEAATTAERRLELLGEAKNKEWKRLMDKQG
ncbi:hypothetical protein B0T25DRAFT_457001 [Lasiosphaeria hispida]|uniref:Uncharacterized protein n=1 Tax=Lasiosphaeria hispida TaxID=260671 RepID=A0AAJ0HE47_9PEZI|nr:hypothetical protein B0T25DRAFT_457001 [Lasiosphaeria hispida]